MQIPQPDRHRQTITAVELANIAGVEANTVRKIAKEMFDMLEKDMERTSFSVVSGDSE